MRSRMGRAALLLLLLLLLCCCCVVVVNLKDARVVGLLATESCLLGSRVLPPITGTALPETDHSSIKVQLSQKAPTSWDRVLARGV